MTGAGLTVELALRIIAPCPVHGGARLCWPLSAIGGALCPNALTSLRSGAASAATASWPEIEPATDGRCSSVGSSRGDGGSPSERATRRASADVRKQLRLRRRRDFDAVFQEGRVLAHRLLVLRTVPNQLQHNRYGFVTSKQLGKAVVRNRVRRRLREGARSLTTRPGWDVVISARAAAAQANFHQLKSAVANLFARAGILVEDTAATEEGNRP